MEENQKAPWYENINSWFKSGLYLININKYKGTTLSQLREKRNWIKFTIWVLLLIVAFLAINAILITILAMTFVDKNALMEKWKELDANINVTQAWNTTLMASIFDIVFPFLILCFLISSFIRCYKEKTYKYISFLSTILPFIQVFYGFTSLIRFAIIGLDIGEELRTNWLFVLNLTLILIYPFIWFFISRNVAIIRRLFIYGEMYENAALYSNATSGGGGTEQVNPFTGQIMNDGATSSRPNNQINENDAFVMRLRSLSKEQLHDMAKQLSISSYESMTDDEIIKIIYDIRNTQTPSQEKEVKVEKEDKEDDKEN